MIASPVSLTTYLISGSHFLFEDIMKICTKCNKEKHLTEFYDFHYTRDGKTSACKECMRTQERHYYHNCGGKRKNMIYRAKSRDKIKKYKDEYKHRRRSRAGEGHDSEKVIASSRVNYAVKTGRLIKPDTCSVCEKKAKIIEGHHHNGYDIENALNVIWLCKDCHVAVHHPEYGKLVKELENEDKKKDSY